MNISERRAAPPMRHWEEDCTKGRVRTGDNRQRRRMFNNVFLKGCCSHSAGPSAQLVQRGKRVELSWNWEETTHQSTAGCECDLFHSNVRFDYVIQQEKQKKESLGQKLSR